MSEALGVSRPTFDVWIKNYRRDTKLLEDHSASKVGEFQTLEAQVKLMKAFIRAHYKLDGKHLRTSQVMPTVIRWDKSETQKLRALLDERS